MIYRLLRATAFILLAHAAFAQFPEKSDANDLLIGAVDMHIHTAPDIFGRSLDDIQVAQLAKSYGLKAIVIKNHVSSTAGRVELVNKVVEGIDVFGGVVLNKAMGGINPYAVEAMARLSPDYGKMVWFPTFDAQGHKQARGMEGEGISISSKGKLTESTEKVLDIIAKYDLALATGHISPEEIILLLAKAREKGINRILLTHPMADTPGMSMQLMKDAVKQGALCELTYLNFLVGPQAHLESLRQSSHISMEKMANVIKEIGAEHFVLTSDLGQSGNPIPPDGMLKFIEGLINEGITREQITLMVKTNPMKLLY